MAADDKDNDRTETWDGSEEGPDRPRIDRLGHFRIEATLGSGGMGTIYRAYDESMKRPVALKVLHSSLEISERAQTRFVREAWIAGQLDHPNIIKVHSRGEENNVSYLAMELAEGGSLHDLVKQTREQVPSGSDVTETVDQDYIEDILAKFVELAGALEHIHSKGFIHRDIKPHNVLLAGKDKKFKFTDFGIAHAEDMTRMTKAGDFIGTVRYMSPELLAAHRAGIDKRTDIYSLGVTLYEALTLTMPFKADSEEKLIGEILAGHYIEARKTNRRIPFDLETVLMKACHHDPDLRYQTAAEFADDLQRVIDGRPVLAKRPSLISRGIKYIRRNCRVASMILVSAIVVAGGFLWQDYRMRKADHDEMSIRMVWSGDKVYTNGLGRITRDGAFVSFSNRMLGDLGILELSKEEIRLLTNNMAVLEVVDTMPEEHRQAFVDSVLAFGRVAYGSVWSPDGNHLAYGWVASSEEQGDVNLIRRDGADAQTLTTGENEKGKYVVIPYDWSEDGAYILAGAEAAGDSTRLLIISATDGSARGLDTIEGPVWVARGRYLSPDGRYVAYTSADHDIFLLSVDRQSHQPLIEHSARDYLLGWSPDGKWVCFASDRSGTTDAWVIGVGDGKPQGEPLRVSRNVGVIVPLGITGEGSLYYGLDSKVTDVYIAGIDLQAGRLLASPEKVTQRFEGTNFYPDWSPDGKYLCYRSYRGGVYNLGAKSPLCVHSIETGEERELFVQLEWFRPHQYSPNGRFAVAYGADNAGQNGLFQIDLESGLATLLVKCAKDVWIEWATWSPEEDRLYYTYRYGNEEPSRLMHYDLITRQEEELFREESWPTCPALSPDGRLLAFQTEDEEELTRTLNIMPADSGLLREIVKLEEDECIHAVDWMPNGETILYVKGTPLLQEQPELWQVSVDGKSLRKIGDFEGMTRFSVHPDGRQIAFSSLKEQTEIWVMENFLPDVP